MSNYPVTPVYGAGYGPRDQNNNSYGPTYPNQYIQGDIAAQSQIGANFDASMSAYGYNQSVPAFPTQNLGTGAPPPLPIYQGWNQASVSVPPYSTTQNTAQYQGYVQNAQAQQSAQYYPPASQPNYQQNLASVQRYEQADLSEGEFEGSPAAQFPINYNGSQWANSNGNGNGYSNTAQRSFHNRNQDYNSQSASQSGNNYAPRSRDTSQMRRQQSDSYSPYAVDEQPQYQPAPSNQAPIGTPKTQNNGVQAETKNQPNGNHTNGWHKGQEGNAQVAQSTLQTATQNIPSQHPTLKGRTIPEMRTEAGKAIRELFPRGVRYPTYLEEGFKEDIISNLFDDVKIPKTTSAHAKIDVEPTNSTTIKFNQQNEIHRATTPALGNKPIITNGARSVSETAVLPAKSVAMDEKQKMLQSKMEALRKSREERAQKAAAKNPLKPVSLSTQTVSAPTHSTPTPSIATQEEEPAQPINTSTIQSSKSPQQLTDDPIPQPLNTTKASPTHSLPTAANMQPQVPLIPGLFLASNTVTPAKAPTPPAAAQTPIINQRKRPVAADFDEPAISSIVILKRPFGHSNNEQPLVINVSEDESEDEDVAMELESQADQDSPIQPARKMSDQRSTPFQNLQSNNLPVRKPFTPPPITSGFSTPPRPQSASKVSQPTPDVLLQKETEIQKLKKMIAEREARAKARQTPSGSGAQTPRGSEAEIPPSKDTLNVTNGILASKIETSIQVQKMITVTDAKVALDQEKLVEAQAAEATKAAEVAQKEAEQKRLRRQKIASDLPLVEAEVQKGQVKLEQLRAEMAKIEADMQQRMDDRRRLSEEMARLSQETDDQLQAQKDKLDELNQQEANNNIGISTAQSPTVAAQPNKPSQDDQVASPPVIESESASIDKPIDKEPDLPVIPHVKNPNHVEEHSNVLSSGAIEEDRDDYKDSISTDRALEAQLQAAVQAQADRHDEGGNGMEIEIPAPEPNQEGDRLPSSPPEDGQINDEYSPVHDRAMPDAPDRESDDYEPPDATSPDNVSEVDSPPFSPAPPDSVYELQNENTVIDSIQAANISGQEDNIDAQHYDKSLVLQAIEHDIRKPTKTQFFTPYESPLKRFRAYRFHPEFKHEIAGGLRSLTYSNKINPNIEFCRYELAGGVCNDPNCAEQHFKAIKLADDHIMAAIGCPDEFQGEQRDKFRASLREVLMGLRVRKVKDFDTISSEIIAHRAKFLGDPSKILAALEGTSL